MLRKIKYRYTEEENPALSGALRIVPCRIYLGLAAVAFVFSVNAGLFPSIARAEKRQSEFMFHAELPTPGEYSLFASGGWDGNWYVGYNHTWIKALSSVNTSGYTKAYLGARLGRAKTMDQIREAHAENENTQINAGPYRILIGISGSRDDKPSAHTLVQNQNIPLEGSLTMALDRVGESRWFWKEVDIESISTTGTNYVHLWSKNTELNSTLTAPILAAGIGSGELENSYLVTEGEVKVIKYFEPAIAVKLVRSSPAAPEVKITDLFNHPFNTHRKVIKTDVSGNYVTEVLLEINDGTGWKSAGISEVSPPYDIVYDYRELEPGIYSFRCRAVNWWGQSGYSTEKTIEVLAE